jgi:hypothetical protein
MDLINLKLKYPFLTKGEKLVFPTLLANALLSQASSTGIKPYITIGNRVYLLGSDTHNFGLRLMDMRVTNGKTKVGGIEIDANLLWKTLKKYCLVLYPMSLAEAIHMSKEKEKRAFLSPGYDFKAGQDVGEF